jgi:hypothetical protein
VQIEHVHGERLDKNRETRRRRRTWKLVAEEEPGNSSKTKHLKNSSPEEPGNSSPEEEPGNSSPEEEPGNSSIEEEPRNLSTEEEPKKRVGR